MATQAVPAQQKWICDRCKKFAELPAVPPSEKPRPPSAWVRDILGRDLCDHCAEALRVWLEGRSA